MQTVEHGKRQAVPAESENLACVDTHCAGIGIPRNEVCVATWQTLQGRLTAVRLWMRSDEESDGNIVPKKSANKGRRVPAELMEGRAPAKGNSEQEAANRIQRRELASNGMQRVRQGTQYSR